MNIPITYDIELIFNRCSFKGYVCFAGFGLTQLKTVLGKSVRRRHFSE